MAKKQVRFYFAYNSPYGFLANQRLARELGPLDVDVEYKPVYSPRPGGAAPDFTAPRFKYMFEDIARFAESYGLALRPGPFADSKKACRGFFFAKECGNGLAFHDGVYRARFLEEASIGDDDTLGRVATATGLPRDAFLEAIRGERYDSAITQSNQDAESDGVFGFPFFVYGGKRF